MREINRAAIVNKGFLDAKRKEMFSQEWETK